MDRELKDMWEQKMMNMNEIKLSPGDVVMLKSGGPAMTVKSIKEDGTITVFWFSGENPVVEEIPGVMLRLCAVFGQ
jgi:uncharacterized protein YodC (DUF2158 family)